MNLQLRRAVEIVLQTRVYLLYRAAVYGLIAVAVALGISVLLLIAAVFGNGAAVVLLVLAVLGGSFGAPLVREYVLYLLKAGHVALIAEIVATGQAPPAASQTAWAKERVTHYFKEISVLALVDQLVKGILAAVNRALFNVLQILPIPGLDSAAKIVERVIYFSLTYIDEAILAYTFKTKNENVFAAAKTGVVLYCHAWQPLLKNAAVLTLLSYLFVAAATVVFMVPLGVLALLLPSSLALGKFLLFCLALFLGVAAKWILFDPLACTSTLLAFLAAADTAEPDPEWEAKIEAVSEQFRTLKDKAAEWVRSHPAAPPAPSAPAPGTPPA